MKLDIELVPKTAWYSNVRNRVEKRHWDVLKKEHTSSQTTNVPFAEALDQNGQLRLMKYGIITKMRKFKR